jgi:hypothetical protein
MSDAKLVGDFTFLVTEANPIDGLVGILKRTPCLPHGLPATNY